MKSIVLMITFALITTISNAQVNTELRIYHLLGNQAFQLNSIAQNNLGHDFKVDRLQYYVSNFSIVHDGGTETAIHIDTIALMNAADGPYSTIELGSLNITSVEAVKFYIGVPQPTNNGDPSLYGPNHPLAPQSPSMHWGWASGYRFLAFEGTGGANFSQVFQIHGLGNSNYFQTVVPATGQLISGNLVIALDADYVRGVEDLNVSNGVIAHGIDQEDLTALENFRDYVFSASTQDLYASTGSLHASTWSISPNPSVSGNVTLDLSQLEIDQVLVTNGLGQKIALYDGLMSSLSMELPESGIYFISLLNDGKSISTKRIVKQ